MSTRKERPSTRTPILLALACAALLVSGCASRVPVSCKEGTAIPCTCIGGGSGKALCQADGTYGACGHCGAGTDAGFVFDQSRDLDHSPNLDHSPSNDHSTQSKDLGIQRDGLTTARLLVATADKVLAAYPTPQGIIVVTDAAVSLFDRQGNQLKRLPSPRQIRAAALSATHLATVDGSMITVYTPALVQLRAFLLKRPCDDAVIVSGERLVCGADISYNRTFETYDLAKGVLVASSPPLVFSRGKQMRRLPGKDYFITVSAGSPPDYYLHQVATDGVVSFIADSPYHGDFAISHVYAFDQGAVHLITYTGILLKVVGSHCQVPLDNDCFLINGAVGTLRTLESFAALASDGTGTLYGLAGYASNYRYCSKGCELQRIDMASRSITAKKTHTFKLERLVQAEFDKVEQALLIAYQNGPFYYVTLLTF